MAIPLITVLSQDKTKISDETNKDQCIATFSADSDLIAWVAKANKETILENHNGGIEVESGGSLSAGSIASVYVEDNELTLGDGEYHISIFGKNNEGYWSDGDYDPPNLIDLSDIDYINYSSYSNNNVIFNTGSLNDPEDTPAIKVQELKEDWSYYRQLLFNESLGNVSINITKTSQYDRIRLALHGGRVDGAILINAESLMRINETYTLAFTIESMTTNYAVISGLSLTKAVV